MKYLGIILNGKFRFQEHVKYAADRCAKLIYNLSRAAKLSWGIKHEAIANIYKGAILLLLTYGAQLAEIRSSETPHQYTNGEGVSNYVKRGE